MKRRRPQLALRRLGGAMRLYPSIWLDESDIDVINIYLDPAQAVLVQQPTFVRYGGASGRGAFSVAVGADQRIQRLIVSYLRSLLAEWSLECAHLSRTRMAVQRRGLVQMLDAALGRWPTADDIIKAIRMPHYPPVRAAIQADLLRLEYPQPRVDRSANQLIERCAARRRHATLGSSRLPHWQVVHE